MGQGRSFQGRKPMQNAAVKDLRVDTMALREKTEIQGR